MKITAERLQGNPIIHPGLDDRMGTNINGPSLIRMPEWAPGLGRYHLYFAHHVGRYIRLAFADWLTGPWQVHRPGVLDVAESWFWAGEPPSAPHDERPDWAGDLPDNYLLAHIASPDMHIDQTNRRIIMYYHGMLPNGDQQTRLAISSDGLNFKAREPLLGTAYFRVFHHGGSCHALAWGGELWRAERWEGPFECGPVIIEAPTLENGWRGLRHCAVHIAGDRACIFYSRIGDNPERILYAGLDLTDDWQTWRAGEPTVLLEPQEDWEGADLPAAPSKIGAVHERARQLRDPAIFIDGDGSAHLLYSGAGESAIGIARLTGL